MNESKPVPRVVVEGLLLPAPLKIEWSCHCCPFRVSAVSERSLYEAMEDHTRYVNTHLDPATDPHFAEVRIDKLLHI